MRRRISTLVTDIQRSLRMLGIVIAFVLSTMLCAPLPLHAQRLTWLGTIGGDDSMAYSVSADGSVVVGVAQDVNGRERAFRWTTVVGLYLAPSPPLVVHP